jgi:hypothetical protein
MSSGASNKLGLDFQKSYGAHTISMALRIGHASRHPRARNAIRRTEANVIAAELLSCGGRRP